jgi:uroporphyrinogen III methyltransferase / synthase
MQKAPFVFIVGAGPGDPSLLTVRGRDCLSNADVILYDHRIPAAVLGLAREDAERIDVGAAAPKALDQDAISYLLADKAREGKLVVRLKWGDPFVFDSGGKEAIFLHEQGIPFEVVPGVPVAVAGPAYAGVPLTYPEAGDAVTLIRGNEAETDESPHLNWTHVAGVGGTIVCYAGARQIKAIAHALLTHGRPGEESAALIYHPTTPNQQTIDGSLSDIAERALEDRPALLVVGQVVGLRGHLRWFDSRPLFGRRIVVTRAREQAAQLAEALEERGAHVIALPAIRILPPTDDARLDEACDHADTFDWLVFTSTNAVHHFLRRFLARRDIRELKGPRICTVGPSTAAAIGTYGLRVDLTASAYRSEGIVEALRAHGAIAGERFLLPRSEIARELLVDELRDAGAYVEDVAAYTTVGAPEGSGQELYRMLLDRQIDAVTFTSASTVRHFVDLIGVDQAADLLRTTTVAAIGPVTAEAAAQVGIAATVVPGEFTIPALVDALVDFFNTPAPSAPALS